MSKKRKNKVICPLTKIECDSKAEMYFIWWLQHLKDTGYILSFKRSKTYKLSVSSYFMNTSGVRNKQESLLRPHVYTPDFTIAWSKKALNVFYCNFQDVCVHDIPFISYNNEDLVDFPISIIDVKGQTNARIDRTGSINSFIINQKWLFKEHSLYVQMIEIKKLFIKTFTPPRYLFTDTGGRKRKINWNIRGLKEYVENTG